MWIDNGHEWSDGAGAVCPDTGEVEDTRPGWDGERAAYYVKCERCRKISYTTKKH